MGYRNTPHLHTSPTDHSESAELPHSHVVQGQHQSTKNRITMEDFPVMGITTELKSISNVNNLIF
jgi:hypothetical protein